MKKLNSPKEMTPDPKEPPGMERDDKGRAIPMAQRLSEDRAKAKRAAARRKTTHN
jgi:hypothetical protein